MTTFMLFRSEHAVRARVEHAQRKNFLSEHLSLKGQFLLWLQRDKLAVVNLVVSNMLLSLIDLNATNYFLNCVQSYRYLILFGVFCLYVVLVRYRAGLRDIPGLWFASVSSIWRFAVVWKQDMPATSVRLHEEYGPLVRIGPHHVSVADPEALKVIYGADGRYHKVR